MQNLWIVLSLVVFVALIVILVLLNKKFEVGFTLRVFVALGMGLAYGAGLLIIFGSGETSETTSKILSWVNILSTGFTRSLQFVIIPLVLVSIISAVARLSNPGAGAKKAIYIIGFLLLTTAVAATVTIGIVKIFGLNADNLVEYNPSDREPQSIQDIILMIIPSNLFAALSSNSVLPIVFIAVFVGFIYIRTKKVNPPIGRKFESGLDVAYYFVMTIVDYIIAFTPYGVLAIVSRQISISGWDTVLDLGLIILVTYIAMAIVFALHIAIMWILGVSPTRYFKKAGPSLIFAFSSRSSSATLPLTIKAQRALGVSESNANLAGSFGTCIGQNACAGVYPVTVAILVGLVQGMDVWTPGFLIPLIIYSVIASIGTSGAGGGATNVALMVLGLMGLPVELVTILLSVDFLIDMGRTAVNVNDGIVAGFVVGKLEKDINKDVLYDRVVASSGGTEE